MLFDWGNTLVRFEWDNDLLEAGHRGRVSSAVGRGDEAAGVHRALPVGDLPAADAERRLRRDAARGARAGSGGGRAVRRRRVRGVAAGDDARGHGARAARVAAQPGTEARASWRTTGPSPAWLVRKEIEEFGVAERVDTIVLSGEVGVRKPDPAIFLRALVGARRQPRRGDVRRRQARLRHPRCGRGRDGHGAGAVVRGGRRDRAPEPDFMAFTLMDVLTAVRRVAAAD